MKGLEDTSYKNATLRYVGWSPNDAEGVHESLRFAEVCKQHGFYCEVRNVKGHGAGVTLWYHEGEKPTIYQTLAMYKLANIDPLSPESIRVCTCLGTDSHDIGRTTMRYLLTLIREGE